MSLTDPATIMGWLEKIDKDLAKQANEMSSLASRYFNKKRDFELEMARAYVIANGSNQKERESNALIAVQRQPVYAEFIAAEAGYNAALKVTNILETRATICQSLLKIHAREAQYG